MVLLSGFGPQLGMVASVARLVVAQRFVLVTVIIMVPVLVVDSNVANGGTLPVSVLGVGFGIDQWLVAEEAVLAPECVSENLSQLPQFLPGGLAH